MFSPFSKVVITLKIPIEPVSVVGWATILSALIEIQ
ncbi:Uncharacterised protein [Vibrio cholerae]|nr:Uncharacterised protein [Vibrio cholerae]